MDIKNTPTNLFGKSGQRLTGRITIDDLKHNQWPSPVEGVKNIKRRIERHHRIQRMLDISDIFLTCVIVSIVLCIITPIPLLLIACALLYLIINALAEPAPRMNSGQPLILGLLFLVPHFVTVGLVHLATWFMLPHDSYINMEAMAFLKFLAWLGL